LNGPDGLALNGNDLYISEYYGDKISKIDITATLPTIAVDVIAGIDGADGMVFNGNDLYVAAYWENKIYKIDITDITPTAVEVVVSGIDRPDGIILNGNDLYIAEGGNSKISKIDTTASTPTTAIDFVTGLSGPSGILLNGDDLYVTEFFSDRVSKVDITTLFIPESLGIQNVNIFPNPTKGEVTISLNSPASYSLVNMLGQEIQKGTFIFGDNTLDVSQLSKGLYFLNIKSSQGTATKKIIKQ